eukprot:snap_masked-scaffold_4-processed-gene-9.24-mRNA-1 protein AED:0.11 eAED:0.11 QI:0/0/0/0.5/1/1/2/0/210
MEETPEIPLEKITLYFNDLCFVERRASTPAERFQVKVSRDTSDIAIKSFSASYKDNFQVVEVKITPSKPKQQFSGALGLSSNHNLGDFLRKVLGEEVVVDTREKSVRGKVFLVEERERPIIAKDEVAHGKTNHVEKELLLNLFIEETAAIEKVNLLEIDGLRLVNPLLQKKLVDALMEVNRFKIQDDSVGKQFDGDTSLLRIANSVLRIH